MTDRQTYLHPLAPTFSTGRHDRAAQHRRDPDWLTRQWPSGQVLVVNDEFRVPVVEIDSGLAISWRDPSAVDQDADRTFLGEDDDGTPYFMVRSVGDDGDTPWRDLRAVGIHLSDLDAGLLVEAIALARWHQVHPRCPRCGAPTIPVDAGWSRRCPEDGSDHFPRTDPAVIMVVHDGNGRCVLGRAAGWPAGRLSVLAGFVEPGESLEAAVAREVREEVGLEVTDVNYVASQPWPFPASIMLGYTARAVGDLELRLTDDELAEAHWMTRDQVREHLGEEANSTQRPISISRTILYGWLNGLLPR